MIALCFFIFVLRNSATSEDLNNNPINILQYDSPGQDPETIIININGSYNNVYIWSSDHSGASGAGNSGNNRQCIPGPTAQNCNEAMGVHCDSGVYTIHQILPYSVRPFSVYCLKDPNGGRAWTIIQRRIDGSEDFYRDWEDYKHGFGNKAGEYFIGLDLIYALTNVASNELWIKMEDFENETRDAFYDSFRIGNEDHRYILELLGNYSGTAGDSLTYHRGLKWSTKDFKQDHSVPGNCAQDYHGAWWYRACHHSNLNGLYLNGSYSKDDFGKGINWGTWHGYLYSLKYVHMAIR